MTDLRNTLQLLQSLSSQYAEDDESLLLALSKKLGEEHPVYLALLQQADTGPSRKGSTHDTHLRGCGPHGPGGGLNDKQAGGEAPDNE
ncbi:MAG: hypothetical protein GY862_16195 [Gammaproteobacteria bacterium]|nr:hypothetical protein [Gammaproteobacteria bacterium]